MIFLLKLVAVVGCTVVAIAAFGVVAFAAVMMILTSPLECEQPVPKDQQLIFSAVKTVAARKNVDVYQHSRGWISLFSGEFTSPTSPSELMQTNPDCCQITRDEQQMLYQPGVWMRREYGPFVEVRVKYDVTYAKRSGEQGVQRIDTNIVFDRCGNEINLGR